MVRISVVDKNDIVKTFFKTTVILAIILLTLKYIKNKSNINMDLKYNKESSKSEEKMYSYMDSALPVVVSKTNEDLDEELIPEEKVDKSIEKLQKMLEDELTFINNIRINDNIAGNEAFDLEDKPEKNQEYNIAQGVDYSKVGSTTKVCNVSINNQTKFALDENILSGDLNIFKDKNKSKILIINTHTSESYTASPDYSYTQTGTFRTQDSNFNVVNVGRKLNNVLSNNGFCVLQDETYHDYPAYNGSYNRSLQTAQKYTKADSNVEIVFDVHRDAVGSNSAFRPLTKVDGKDAAQLMFVVGTNGGGLEHDNWRENLKLAIKIQQKGNEMYPGLFRPIIVRNSRYNQNVAKGALIIEVGATGNTMEDCLTSMESFGKIINEVLK